MKVWWVGLVDEHRLAIPKKGGMEGWWGAWEGNPTKAREMTIMIMTRNLPGTDRGVMSPYLGWPRSGAAGRDGPVCLYVSVSVSVSVSVFDSVTLSLSLSLCLLLCLSPSLPPPL